MGRTARLTSIERCLKWSAVWWATILLCLPLVAHAANADIELIDLAGEHHRLSDYRGKWVLVNYWATWCPPCLDEIPDLIHLYDQQKGHGLMVIGIAFEYRNAAEVAAFVDDMLISYPIVLGNAEIAAAIGPATVLPTSYIFDPHGRLFRAKRGVITKAEIEGLLNTTVDGEPSK